MSNQIVTKIQATERDKRMTELAAVLKALGPAKNRLDSRVRVLLATELARLALEACAGTPAAVESKITKEDRAAHRGKLLEAWRSAKDKAIAAVIPADCKITVTVYPVVVRGMLTVKAEDTATWDRGKP